MLNSTLMPEYDLCIDQQIWYLMMGVEYYVSIDNLRLYLVSLFCRTNCAITYCTIGCWSSPNSTLDTLEVVSFT